MTMPLQITFRNIVRTDAIELDIQERALLLQDCCEDVTSCRVIVEKGHQYFHGDQVFHVHIDVTVPGDEIIISRTSGGKEDEGPHRSIRKAFDATRRRLMAYLSVRQP